MFSVVGYCELSFLHHKGETHLYTTHVCTQQQLQHLKSSAYRVCCVFGYNCNKSMAWVEEYFMEQCTMPMGQGPDPKNAPMVSIMSKGPPKYVWSPTFWTKFRSFSGAQCHPALVNTRKMTLCGSYVFISYAIRFTYITFTKVGTAPGPGRHSRVGAVW